jgi:hypothetical protein
MRHKQFKTQVCLPLICFKNGPKALTTVVNGLMDVEATMPRPTHCPAKSIALHTSWLSPRI